MRRRRKNAAMRTGYRAAAVCLLLVATLGLAVHYGATEPWPHPDGDDLTAEPAAHDGEPVLLFGTVEAVERDGTLLMTVGSEDGDDIAIEVRAVDAAILDELEPGGIVQVYGPLAADANVQTADEVVVVESSPADRLYKYGVSVVGGLLAAGLFLRHWRIDFRRLRFVPRERGATEPPDGERTEPANRERTGCER